jgi:hypothetical protein
MNLLWGRIRVDDFDVNDDDFDVDDDDDNNNNNNDNNTKISVELLSRYCLGNDRIKEYDWEQLLMHDTSYTALLIRNTPVSDTKHILT